MTFFLITENCEPGATNWSKDKFIVRANYIDHASGEQRSDERAYTLDELLAQDSKNVQKAQAVIAYAVALQEAADSSDSAAAASLDKARAVVEQAAIDLGGDPELEEISSLLSEYRKQFE